MTDTDPLAALLAALAANARDWRARGRDCCAQEAEQMHARLTEAIEQASNDGAPGLHRKQDQGLHERKEF